MNKNTEGVVIKIGDVYDTEAAGRVKVIDICISPTTQCHIFIVEAQDETNEIFFLEGTDLLP